jgi:hypothetical protein
MSLHRTCTLTPLRRIDKSFYTSRLHLIHIHQPLSYLHSTLTSTPFQVSLVDQTLTLKPFYFRAHTTYPLAYLLAIPNPGDMSDVLG